MNTSHLGFGESRGSEEAASAHDTLKHLLLVEDDPRLGPIMRQVLQASWDVRLVVNGREAFDAATRTYFDVMIVDRRIPDMDGAELVASLRRRSISGAAGRRRQPANGGGVPLGGETIMEATGQRG